MSERATLSDDEITRIVVDETAESFAVLILDAVHRVPDQRLFWNCMIGQMFGMCCAIIGFDEAETLAGFAQQFVADARVDAHSEAPTVQ